VAKLSELKALLEARKRTAADARGKAADDPHVHREPQPHAVRHPHGPTHPAHPALSARADA
jgi:hypothetical protein